MTVIFLFASLLISVACFFIFKIEPQVAAAIAGGSMLAVFLISIASSYVGSSSTEILNGQVTSKERDRVSCSHDYKCRCKNVPKKRSDGSTYYEEECDTCYDHDYDYNWNVDSTLGSYRIDRVNRQGTIEPPRWTSVKIGDPVADTHTYTNWIKSSDSSLFNVSKNRFDQFKDKIPAYPKEIYDYYNIDRIVTLGLKVNDQAKLNRYISEQLRQLGPKKQVNLIFVVTKIQDPTYADAIWASWKGAEKNDVVVVVGTQNGEINWVKVQSWAEFDIFNVKLRDRIMDSKVFKMKNIIDMTVDETYKSYQRKPMKQFEYLKDETRAMPLGTMIFIGILIVLVHGISIGFVLKDRYERRKNWY